jgi:YD repeat-containing protein
MRVESVLLQWPLPTSATVATEKRLVELANQSQLHKHHELQLSGSLLTLAASGERPSLVRDKNGYPAVGWVYRAAGVWEVRFLRAKSDPTLLASWVNATGTSATPDVLGARGANAGPGTVSLARIPRGTTGSANDDALYLFWTDSTGGMLRWSRARTTELNYLAWTTPSDKVAVTSSELAISTVADVRNQAIVVGYHATNGTYGIIRKLAANDSNASDVVVLDPAVGPSINAHLSLGMGRGDLYAFYGSSGMFYRRHSPETGWTAATTVVASLAKHATALRDAGAGRMDVAYAYGGSCSPPCASGVYHHGFLVGRPYIQNLALNPSSFIPSLGDTTTVTYRLVDNASTALQVTVRVHDSGGTLVRTLVNGSQTLTWHSSSGTYRQEFSIPWDGKNDAGVVLPPAAYTVKVNATDDTSLAAPEQTATAVIIGGQTITLSYAYDRLYRMTSATAPGGTTTYAYNALGNRLSMTRGGVTTSYAYDRVDRIDAAGATDYLMNLSGNAVSRGGDTFSYDQANRLTGAMVNGTATSY